MNKKRLIKLLEGRGIASYNGKALAEASVEELRGLERQTQNSKLKTQRVFDFGCQRLSILVPAKVSDKVGNEAEAAQEEEEAVEIMFYEEVGSDPWGGRGMSAADFQKALSDAIPNRDRDLHVRVNSRGGDVFEGFAIKNILDNWPMKTMATVEGVAASTASWMILGCDEVRANKASQMFIHDAVGFCFGNAEDMSGVAAQLDKTSQQIAEFYAEKSGKGARTMRDKMRDETLLTGDEAKELGLVDTVLETRATRNFSPEELAGMRNRLKTLYNNLGGRGAGSGVDNNMKKKLVGRLNKLGITHINNKGEKVEASAAGAIFLDEKVEDDLLELAVAAQIQNSKAAQIQNSKFETQEEISAAAELRAVRQDLAKLTEANNAAKKLRITGEIEGLIANDQIPATMKDKAIARALLDEEYLNELKMLPSRPPGGEPLTRSVSVELVGEDFKDVQNFCISNGPGFRAQFIGPKGAGRTVDKMVCREIGTRALAVANAIAKHKSKIVAAWNSNAIDSQLQRQVILQDMLEAYAIMILKLEAFTVVYENIPLEGTDKVEVPYFPLQGTASTSFVKGTGYTTSSDWTENSREISVGGDGNSATSGINAAANTARDRKYQLINFTSYDLRRQPYLNLVKLFQQAANKLGVDIFTDIVSRVVTVANFGASVKAVAAAAFSADDVADIRTNVTGRYWPLMGRALAMDHTYYGALLKDPSFKQYLAYGSTDPIQQGRIANAYGFDSIYEVPSLTTYSPAGENLVGWANHKSAVLVATANIMPTPAVRVLLEVFDIVVHERLGVSFAYRKFGDTVKDQTNEVIESSYGAGKGVDAALARMTSQ